jgi:hypothetical protein
VLATHGISVHNSSDQGFQRWGFPMIATLLDEYRVRIWAGWRRLTSQNHPIAILTAALLSQSAMAAPVFFNITGHYYEFVASDASWSQARELAKQRSFMGQVGYLATIPTVRENTFLTAAFTMVGADRLAWTGGHEPNNDAAWRWADGPEAGERFSQSEHPVFPLFFANWGGNEPDAGGASEDFVVINLGPTFGGIETGEWSAVAASPSPGNPVRGYLVEYGGIAPVPEPASAVVWLSLLGVLVPTRRGEWYFCTA